MARGERTLNDIAERCTHAPVEKRVPDACYCKHPLSVAHTGVSIGRERFHKVVGGVPATYPLRETGRRMDWRSQAACVHEDPELFFPVGTTGPAVEQSEEAKRVCARCEVREPCLEFAIATNQDAGVWGGLTEDERRSLRRARQRRRRLAS